MNIFNEEFKIEFYQNNFQKNYLYYPGIVDNYKNIMSNEILNKMLSIKNIWNNKNFIMMLDRKRINYSEFSKPTLDTTGNNLRPDPKNVQKLISNARWLLIFSWTIYPIIYLFPIFYSNTSAVHVQIGYTVADLISIAVFGVMIYLIAQRKSDVGS